MSISFTSMYTGVFLTALTVDQSQYPEISGVLIGIETKCLGPVEVGTIGPRLIPTSLWQAFRISVDSQLNADR